MMECGNGEISGRADGNGERRLNTWVATGAAQALRRLARHHGVSQREMLERLILDADERIVKALDPDSAAWVEYFGVTV
jgi:uncharacterized protein YidB (DUF937 family)